MKCQHLCSDMTKIVESKIKQTKENVTKVVLMSTNKICFNGKIRKKNQGPVVLNLAKLLAEVMLKFLS